MILLVKCKDFSKDEISTQVFLDKARILFAPAVILRIWFLQFRSGLEVTPISFSSCLQRQILRIFHVVIKFGIKATKMHSYTFAHVRHICFFIFIIFFYPKILHNVYFLRRKFLRKYLIKI